ncbi:MAG: hypothetical protein K2P63_11175, partial [Lachnospiraceae bacterium]|nr:hypothetical protein [Lachnospiraceae bacterium]
MSDLLRMTGMYSGMDTDAVIQQLIKAKSQKVTTLKHDQKKLDWKISKWQDLNKRIYKLYTGTLSNMRLTGSYAKKKTKVSDPTKATITAGEAAVNGTQTLHVKQTAASGYLTGAMVSKKVQKVTGDTTLKELGVTGGSMNVTVNGSVVGSVNINQDDSIDTFISNFNSQFAGDDIKMTFENGKITVSGANGGDPAGGAQFGFDSVGPTGVSPVWALGLSDMTTSDNVSGSTTGKKIRITGSSEKDETNTTLEELNIMGGKLT